MIATALMFSNSVFAQTATEIEAPITSLTPKQLQWQQSSIQNRSLIAQKIGEEGAEKKGEELEITDLVKSQKNIETKQEEYFDNLFKHLEDLESKLSNMDQIVTKLNDLEAKVEKYRVKTPEEKLELRSLDSGPFNQKLSDFFEDKEIDMEKSGKNEYVLTKNEVEEYSPIDIKKSFRDFGDEETGDFTEVR